MLGIGLSTLEKSAKTLAVKLKKEGYECEVSKFVDPSSGGGLYGGSYITLTVESDSVFGEYEFYSIYCGLGSCSFSGQNMKWSEMKAAVLNDIEAQVTSEVA